MSARDDGDTISILGGGWSAAGLDFERAPGFRIGVNDAAILAPCEALVSMDRLWTENRWEDLLRAPLDEIHLRRSAVQNIEPLPAFVRVFENDHTSVDFAETRGTLNGTNSGACALNLAYQRRPRRVILFGFDMNRSPDGRAYWFPDYPWAKPGGSTTAGKYRAWAAEFEVMAAAFRAAGIEVLNASPSSAITAFRKVPAEEVLA